MDPVPRPAGEPARDTGAPVYPGDFPHPGDPGGHTGGAGQPGHPGQPGHDRGAGGSHGPGLFPPPPHDAVRGRLTDATLARALTDEVLAARLIDEVIASLPAEASAQARRPRVYPAAVIPFGHGLAALATFVMAVVTAIGTR